MSIESSGSRR